MVTRFAALDPDANPVWTTCMVCTVRGLAVAVRGQHHLRLTMHVPPCVCCAPSQADNLPAVDAKMRFRLERIDRVNNDQYFDCTQSNKNVISSALGDDPLQFLNVYSCAIPNMAIGFVA